MDFNSHLEALKDGRPQARIDAVAALVRIGPAALAPLAEMALDQGLPAHARACAVKALGGIGGEGAGEAITGALSDPDPVVKIPAAMALGQLGYAKGAGALAALFDDPSSLVRKHASEGIACIVGLCTSAEALVSLKGEVFGVMPEGKKTGAEAAYVLGKMVEKARYLMASEKPADPRGSATWPQGGGSPKMGAIKH